MELNKDELKELRADSMDDTEIKAQDGDIKIVVYNDLKDYEYIGDLLPKKKDYVILLYQTESETSGHWVALCRDNNNIYYFDSYGKPADEPQKWNTKGIMKPNLLSDLLDDDNFNVYENDKAYQKHAYLINTCGRHCVNFIEFFKNFNFDLFDYYKAMKELKTNLKKSYDDIVCTLINEF